MKSLLRRVRELRTGSGKGVVTIASGLLVGQLILVAATPFLSRLYPPESYGVFSVILSISAMIGPVAALTFESALLLPDDEVTARRLLRLGGFSAVVTSTVTGLAVWFIEILGGGGSWSEVSFAPVWVAAMVFATASFTLLTQAAMRVRSYSTVAKRSITQSLGVVSGQLALATVTRGPVGLLGGFLFGRMLGFVPLIITAKSLLLKPTSGSYRAVLKRYWRFPAVFTPSTLLNSLGSQLPLIFIAVAFGSANAGELGMAQRLVAIPVTLLGASVAEVFAAELSKRLRESRGGGREIYLKTSAWMALIGLVIAVMLLLLAPWLLPLVLGSEWAHAGAFTQAMSISVGIGLVASPVSRVFMIYQRSRASIIVDFARVVLLAFAIVATLVWDTSALGSVWLIYMAQATDYTISWVYGLKVVSRTQKTSNE